MMQSHGGPGGLDAKDQYGRSMKTFSVSSRGGTLAVAVDGTVVATNGPVVARWDGKTGKLLGEKKFRPAFGGSDTDSCVLSPDGSAALFGGTGCETSATSSSCLLMDTTS